MMEEDPTDIDMTALTDPQELLGMAQPATVRESGFPAPVETSAQALASRVATLERETEILRTLVRYLACPAPSAEGQALPVELRVTAAATIDGFDGFHGLEQDGFGRAYRWTGPSRVFGINVTLDRSVARSLTVEFCATRHPENITGLRGFADAEELSLTHVEGTGPSTYQFTAPLPARPPGGVVRIWFAAPHVIAPTASDPLSSDERALGLAFVSLQVA